MSASLTLSGGFAALAGFLRRMSNPAFQGPLNEIGLYMVAATERRFAKEVAPDGSRWKPSQRALNDGGQTLTDTRRLRNSITHQAGRLMVEIGTNVKYAPDHQFGEKAGRVGALPVRAFLGFSAQDRKEIERILSGWLGGQMR